MTRKFFLLNGQSVGRGTFTFASPTKMLGGRVSPRPPIIAAPGVVCESYCNDRRGELVASNCPHDCEFAREIYGRCKRLRSEQATVFCHIRKWAARQTVDGR